MKVAFKSMLFAGILVVSGNSALVAQTGSSWVEQWYRAKYGRPSPTEQARMDGAKRPVARPGEAIAATRARRANAWLEQFYKDKYGRVTPREEARVREANLGKDAVMTSKAVAPADLGLENRYRAKYGRPAPSAETR